MTREEAIKGLTSLVEVRRKYVGMQTMKDEIECLEMAIKALEQESCEDAISRQEAVEAFQMFREYESNRNNKGWVDRIETVLNQLPPVNPQPKIGHWIEGKYKDTCDKCRCTYPKNIGFKNYCPNCGAKMVEPQAESEVGNDK